MINDLVNRELIRKDFKFLQPVFVNDKEEKKEIKAMEMDEEDKNFEIIEDNSPEMNLAKYLRENQPDIEISPEKAKNAQAEQEYLESQVDQNEWENEYRRAKEKLREAVKISEKDKYIYNTHRLTRYFQRMKDIMALVGNTTLNNYVFLCDNSLNSISKHEKRLNAYIPRDLVCSKYFYNDRLVQ